MKNYVDEELVAALVAAAHRGDKEERAGVGPSPAVVRSLSRHTGYSLEVCATALVVEDVAALFGVAPVTDESMRAMPRLTGEVRCTFGDDGTGTR